MPCRVRVREREELFGRSTPPGIGDNRGRVFSCGLNVRGLQEEEEKEKKDSPVGSPFGPRLRNGNEGKKTATLPSAIPTEGKT